MKIILIFSLNFFKKKVWEEEKVIIFAAPYEGNKKKFIERLKIYLK